MIIKHMNEAIKEPISALHQAFKGSARDSEIRRLNSLRTFDDRPLLTVIGGIKRRRAKLLCLTARQHTSIPANRTQQLHFIFPVLKAHKAHLSKATFRKLTSGQRFHLKRHESQRFSAEEALCSFAISCLTPFLHLHMLADLSLWTLLSLSAAGGAEACLSLCVCVNVCAQICVCVYMCAEPK